MPENGGPGIVVSIGANAQGLVTGLEQATSALKSHTTVMTSLVNGLGQSFENILAPIKGVIAILGGGALFSGAINEAKQYVSEASQLSRTLGISMEMAGGMGHALEALGMSSGEFATAAFRVQMQLRHNEEWLNDNKIATRGLNGEMLPLMDVMTNALGRLRGMSQGYAQNEIALKLFGRSAKELTNLQKLTTEKIREGMEESKAYGIVLGKTAKEDMAAFKAAQVDAHNVLSNLEIRIGLGVMPKLTEMAKAFSDMGPTIVNTIVSALGFLVKALGNTGVQITLIVAMLAGPFRAAIVSAVAWLNGLATSFAVGQAYGLTAFTTLTGAARTFGATLYTALGPVGLIALGIAAVIGLWQAFRVSAEEAAEATVKNVKASVKANDEFRSLSAELQDESDKMKKAKDGTEEKAKATKRVGEIIEELNKLYPDFNSYLEREKGHHDAIARAIKAKTADRIRDMEVQRDQLGADLRAAEQRLAMDIGRERQRKQFAGGSALLEWTVGGKLLDKMFAGEDIEGKTAAVEKLKASFKELAAAIKSLTGDDKPTGDDKVVNPQKAMQDLDDRLNAEKRAKENFLNWNDQKELDFWNRSSTRNRIAAIKNPEERRRAEESAEQKRFGLREKIAKDDLSERKANLDLAARLDEANVNASIEARITLANESLKLYGQDSKEYAAALRDKWTAEDDLDKAKQAQTLQRFERERGYEQQALDMALKRIEFEKSQGKKTEGDEVGARLASLQAQLKIENDLYEARMAAEPVQEKQNKLTDDHKLKVAELTLEYQKLQASLSRVMDQSSFNTFSQKVIDLSVTWKESWQAMGQYAGAVITQMSSKMAQGLQSMVKGQLSLKAAVQGLWKLLLDTSLQIAAQLLTTEITTRIAAKLSNIGKTEGNIAAAASGAAAAASPAGPAAALAASASVIGGLHAQTGPMVAMAAKGYDIPRGVNPFIQGHSEEMMLPAKYANPLRELLTGGAGGAPALGGGATHNWTVHAFDGKDVERMLHKYRRLFSSAATANDRDGI